MALYIPGVSEQDQLLTYLAKNCNLTSDQQAYVRKKLDQVYDGAINNYKELLEKEKPEPRRVKKSRPDDVSTKDDLHREQEMNWHREMSQQDLENFERWSD